MPSMKSLLKNLKAQSVELLGVPFLPQLNGKNNPKKMVPEENILWALFSSLIYYPNSVSLYGDSRVSGNTCFSPFL